MTSTAATIYHRDAEDRESDPRVLRAADEEATRLGWPGELTIVQALEACAGQDSRGFTFIDDKSEERFVPFSEVASRAAHRAAKLLALGLEAGDRVAIVLPDPEHFVSAFLGTLWAGMIPVPLYPPLSMGKLDAYRDAMTTVMGKAGVRAILSVDWLAPVYEPLREHVVSLAHIVDLETQPEQAPVPAAVVHPDDVAFLQYTSGSTSLPKGVMVTHASLTANARMFLCDAGHTDPTVDVGVSWLPMYHDMGLIAFVLAPLFIQAPVVFLSPLLFLRQPTSWLDTLHRFRGTITSAPNFAYGLAAAKATPEQIASWDLSCVRAFGCGAEPIRESTMTKFVESLAGAGVRPDQLVPCYGMAEATVGVTFHEVGTTPIIDRIDPDAAQREGGTAIPSDAENAMSVYSCGRTGTRHRIRIAGPDGKELPERSIGEIQFRGPSVAAGYWFDVEATNRTFDADGWLHTGDHGYLSAGNLYVIGRVKDLLIINGRNYDPTQVEWALTELAGVRAGNVAAFTRPGEDTEELVVVLETRTPSDDLRGEVRRQVKRVTQLTVADVVLLGPGELPKTSSGKLQRSATRRLYLSDELGTTAVPTRAVTA